MSRISAFLLLLALAAPARAQDSLSAYWTGEAARAALVAATGHGRAGNRHADRPGPPLQLAGGLLAEASRYIGRGKVTPYAGPWCRDFINLVASRAGYRLANRSRRAIDALALGPRVASPRPGDLVVMRSHVTIYAGMQGGRIAGLGGNQGRGVRVSHYDARRVIAFVRLAG